MRTDEPRAARIGSVLLAFIAGLLGGAVAVGLLSIGPKGSSEPAAFSGNLDSLDRRLQELIAVLRERPVMTSAQLPQLDAAPREPRGASIEPLQPSATDLAPLLGRLDALIARLEVSGAPSGAPLQIPDEAARTSALTELFASDMSTVGKAHRLMTYRQIAERYGKPAGIWIHEDGTVDWRYSRDDRASVTFTFFDGLCRD